MEFVNGYGSDEAVDASPDGEFEMDTDAEEAE